MKFNEYITAFEIAKTADATAKDDVNRLGILEFYRRLVRLASKEKDHNLWCRGLEYDWYNCVRPYYKVWPAIIPALLRIKLDIPLSAIGEKEHDVIGIRLPSGIAIDGFQEATSALCGWYIKGDGIRCTLLSERGDRFQALEIPHISKSSCIDSLLFTRIESNETTVSQEADAVCMNFLHLAFSIRLLQNDPSIIAPDVLSSDRDRYESETDEAWKCRAVDRARRRGIVGWNVGADYEVCPHYRRPHFALRHTGKGGITPKIVPIKGAVVHRSKLTDVPTGYILPSGREVE